MKEKRLMQARPILDEIASLQAEIRMLQYANETLDRILEVDAKKGDSDYARGYNDCLGELQRLAYIARKG